MGIGPFVRYYIPTKHIFPFFEATSSYSYGFVKINNRDTYHGSSSSFALGGGIAIPVGNIAAFDIMAGYNYANSKFNIDNITYITQGFLLKMGFSFVIRTKK